MKIPSITFILLAYSLLSCNGDDSKSSCMENEGKKLLIFVGERIEVKEDTTVYFSGLPYGQYKCRYKILEVICGDYNKKEISFIAYDHYGTPAFSDYKTSLLYVYSEPPSKDSFYHVNYQYDALYKTKDGKWASPYSFMNYDAEDTVTKKIKLHKVEYAEDVSFDVKGMSRQSLNRFYPLPYYSIANKKATAHYGNYIDELVKLKKEGALKSWGFYGNEKAPDKVKVQDITISDITQIEKVNYNKSEITTAFYKFYDAIKKADVERIRKMSLPHVICSVCEEPPRSDYENNFETIDSFIISSFRYIHFSQLEQEIENKNYKVSAEERDTLTLSDNKTKSAIIYIITFTTIFDIENYTYKQTHDFEFIKSNGGYVFYGMRTNDRSSYWIGDRIKRGDKYFKKAN